MNGIEGLSRRSYYREQQRPRSKAKLAALLALLPGMGAVYNRQNIKAVVYFVTIIGLIELTHVKVLAGVFGLAAFMFYLYSIMDSYRTAQLIAAGESPEADEERFKRMIIKRAPIIGVVLITVGLLLVIQLVRPLAFITYARLLPVALILFGGYLLTRYFKRKREPDYSRDYRQPPYPLIPGSFDEQPSEKVKPMWGHRRR
ncbi:MAG TPA: hypothetical protein VNN73_22045 [Blastocatellia bacterium]|nr:hypothetical protein [Blastocatellia bacterium]